MTKRDPKEFRKTNITFLRIQKKNIILRIQNSSKKLLMILKFFCHSKVTIKWFEKFRLKSDPKFFPLKSNPEFFV